MRGKMLSLLIAAHMAVRRWEGVVELQLKVELYADMEQLQRCLRRVLSPDTMESWTFKAVLNAV